MSKIVVLIAMAMLAHAPKQPHAPKQRVFTNHHQRIAGWTLKTYSDAFAGTTSCRLSRHRMMLERGALGLDLGRHAEIYDAIYRIDNGPVFRANEDSTEMQRAGVAVFEDDPSVPSGVMVRVPLDRLTGAREVTIEVKRKLVRFDLGGLGAALDAAKKAGCRLDWFG